MSVRTPSDCVAPGYDGPTALASCPECGHVTYIPDPEVMGPTGNCSECKQIVEWSV